MSKLKVQPPNIIHTPSFKEYSIHTDVLRPKLEALGLDILYGTLDYLYYYTDMEGWGKVLSDLVFKSSLYKRDKFDCENYALKAMNICAERYGLNTLALVIGDSPKGVHGFNIFYHGDGWMLWEPQGGAPSNGSPFEVGEYGYQPKVILI